MEWNTETGKTWLLRIVVLLASLADLADQALLRSRFVRRRVLAALRPAEEAAYRCVADAARAFGAPVPTNAMVTAGAWMAADEGDRPDDVMRLALRLRILAAALVLCLLSAGRFVLPDPGVARAERRKPAMWMGRPAAVPAPDTS